MPLESKTTAFLTIPAPITLKKLRSVLCSVLCIIKFKPNLAQPGQSLESLLKKPTKVKGTETHIKQFNVTKEQWAQITENCHYYPQLAVRVKCDAPKSELGVALEQNVSDGWKHNEFVIRFLKTIKQCYNVNELAMLGIL